MLRQSIEWDDLEECYIDNEGNCMKDVYPQKSQKKIKVRTPSNPRDFFLLDVFPFNLNNKTHPATIEMGYALVKPYSYGGNLRIKYEIMKWDTPQTHKEKMRKEIYRVLKSI